VERIITRGSIVVVAGDIRTFSQSLLSISITRGNRMFVLGLITGHSVGKGVPSESSRVEELETVHGRLEAFFRLPLKGDEDTSYANASP
jgi:hypothetical protein